MASSGSKKAESSLVFGSTKDVLYEKTLGELVDEQAAKYGDKPAVINSWQNSKQSFAQLAERSKILAKAMMDAGLQKGDSVGIFAGSCYQYVELFYGAARIGCPYVVFNNTYTPQELARAATVSECKLLFIAPKIGVKDCKPHIDMACGLTSGDEGSYASLKKVVFLDGSAVKSEKRDTQSYNAFFSNGHSVFMTNAVLRRAEKKIDANDVVNLQFTSGTTGAPKAAMLTHRNSINNGLLIGNIMQLTEKDIICCSPPLFHCFGLTMGLLCALAHGIGIVFPSDQFNPSETLDAIMKEKCTVLYGVPTMFVAELDANKTKKYKFTTLRMGLAAGAPVPGPLMKQIEQGMGIKTVLIAYGMTETSPVTFMTLTTDPLEKRINTVGRVLPHSGAKIISREGKLLNRGERGELCTSGYALQKGYFKNEAKTKEVMLTDENGILWMHTGDECIIDEDGFCQVTGRIKDIIIRGGENIFPVEIENRLLAHEAITEASVVGLKDDYYGEVVAAFLKSGDAKRPDTATVSEFVRKELGSHKAPKYVFWIGDEGVGDDFPKTGSGKHQKHIIRDIGNRLLEKSGKSKL